METGYSAAVGRGQQKSAVLVPMKPFGLAKTRLAPTCTPSQRESLARSMARNVLASVQGLRVAIVAPSSAADVRRFALINGARFLAEPEDAGLNGAVASGVGQLGNLGYERVIVIHSDLPYVRDIRWLADTDGIILVPDRTGNGTNAVSIPAECGFRFSFGPDSFERHCEEARRLGFEPTIVIDPEGVSADVDDPEDAARAGIFVRTTTGS